MYEVELKIYGESCLEPILVVPGQRDDPIIGISFPVAQLVEHGTSNAKIMGSIPRESKT